MCWHDDALTYRYATLDDLPLIVEMLADPEVGRWLWFLPAPPGGIEAYFTPRFEAQARAIEEGNLPLGAEFVVHDRATGEFLGQGAAVPIEGSTGNCEIGYQMARASWGRGNGHRLARFLTAYAVVKRRAHRIQAGTVAGNAASIAVLEGLGLRLEGTLREYRDLRGERVDELIFGALVKELDGAAIQRWAAAIGLA